MVPKCSYCCCMSYGPLPSLAALSLSLPAVTADATGVSVSVGWLEATNYAMIAPSANHDVTNAVIRRDSVCLHGLPSAVPPCWPVYRWPVCNPSLNAGGTVGGAV